MLAVLDPDAREAVVAVDDVDLLVDEAKAPVAELRPLGAELRRR